MRTMPWFGVLLLLVISPTFAGESVRVKGYTRKNGTYVQPSHRTKANKTKIDNWSAKGNVNPYTGRSGKIPE